MSQTSVDRLMVRWADAFDRKLEQLPIIRKEDWPGGVVVTFLKSPFPPFAGRYPHVPSRVVDTVLRDPKATETVRLKDIRSSQSEVTDVGLRKYQNGFGRDLPLLFALADGTFAIQDGHHRLTALWLRGKTSTSAKVVRLG